MIVELRSVPYRQKLAPVREALYSAVADSTDRERRP
jgi:hypothetical protein